MSDSKNAKRWLLALIASVALNIGLVGYLLGNANQSRAILPLAPPNAAISHFLRSLPAARREAIRPAMRAHFKQLRPGIRAHRKAHRELQLVLASETLDVPALRTALQQVGLLSVEQRGAQTESLLNLIGQLTLTERQMLAESMSRPRHRPRRRGDARP